MTFSDVFTHDLSLVRRSKVWETLVVISIGTLLAGYFVGLQLSSHLGPEGQFRHVVIVTWLVGGTLLPFAGMLAAVSGITGEREAGTLRLFASFPVGRSEFVVGKFFARLVTVGSALVIGLGVWVAVAVFSQIPVKAGRLAGFVVFTTLVTGCYAALGTGIAAAVRSTSVARGLAAGIFVGTVSWPRVFPMLADVVSLDPSKSSVRFIGKLTPYGAYSQVVSDKNAILAVDVTTPLLGSGVMATIILVWTIGAVLVGCYYFRRSEI